MIRYPIAQKHHMLFMEMSGQAQETIGLTGTEVKCQLVRHKWHDLYLRTLT